METFSAADNAVYRVHRFYTKQQRPDKYKHSLKIIDEHNDRVVAMCNIVGQQPTLFPQEIVDAEGKSWLLEPNRRIAATTWTVYRPSGDIDIVFDIRLFSFFANPFRKTLLTLKDSQGNVKYCLGDPDSTKLDIVMSGTGPNWVLFDGKEMVARLSALPKKEGIKKKGILGKIAQFIASSDRAIISKGKSHVLEGPTALAMMLLDDEIRSPVSAD